MYDSEQVRNHYNKYGEQEWKRLENSVSGIVEYEVTLHILEKHLAKQSTILDVGGGPGRYSIKLAQMGHKIYLVDISDEQLRLAKEKIAKAGVQDNVLDIKRLDVCEMSELSDSFFDAVICLGGALSYVRDKRFKALTELIRVAKPECPLIVSVMSLLGTFHLISAFDAENFLANIRDHIDWDPSNPFPEILDSVEGSDEWHAPMTLYTSKYMEKLFKDYQCEIIEMAATNAITSSYRNGLEKIKSNPKALEMLLHLEKQFCLKPGLIDMGQRLIVVAITPE